MDKQNNLRIALCTTFPNWSWEVYSRDMLKSFAEHWPVGTEMLVQLDDGMLKNDVAIIDRCMPATDRQPQHEQFVLENANKDGQDYRKQATRFCHKVFTLQRCINSVLSVNETVEPDEQYTHVIWMDADIVTQNNINEDTLRAWIETSGDKIGYLGRKDWDHSECGLMIFPANKRSLIFIKTMVDIYTSGKIFDLDQWHDSYVFDVVRNEFGEDMFFNFTKDFPGQNIFDVSPFASHMVHFKGPQAKKQLAEKEGKMVPLTILTKNCVPDETINRNITENLKIIKKWIKICDLNNETLVFCAAGPSLDIVKAKQLQEKGHKVVAVKHALKRLSDHGVKPWAVILLDPRPHVEGFVNDPDPEPIYFVASQCDPSVAQRLIDSGCKVIGYHALVGAQERLAIPAEEVMINGGSASATRGLMLLNAIGFSRFILLGYDLCYLTKPKGEIKNPDGSTKDIIKIDIKVQGYDKVHERTFWTEGQFVAQINEIQNYYETNRFEHLEAHGDGAVPWLLKHMSDANLRKKEEQAKMLADALPSYLGLLD